MQLRLLQLGVRNFKGLTFDFKTGGQDVDIYGANATGKTTILDAICWLLFDRDGQFGTKMEIKTLDQAGQAIHNLEHEVHGLFQLDDGQEILLRKVYAEKWTKQRGKAERELSGHSTDYWVDGVPVQKKEYVAKVSEIASEEEFKLLTSPSYFADKIDWQARRRLLLAVCGDVDEAAVIASKPELAGLTKIISGRTLEDHRKVVAAKRKEINDQLEKTPVKIGEVQRGLPDAAGIDVAQEANKANEIGMAIERLERMRVKLEEGNAIGDKKKALAEAQAALTKADSTHHIKYTNLIREARKDSYDNQTDIRLNNNAIDDRQRDKTRIDQEIAAAKQTMANLQAEFKQVNAEPFACGDKADTCQHCGQFIPEDFRAEITEKAKANFNAWKSERLKAINVSWRDLKTQVDGKIASLANIARELDELTAKRQSLANEAQTIADTITRLERDRDGEHFAAETKAIADIEAEIAALQQAGPAAEIAKVETAIEAEKSKLAEVSERIGRVEAKAKGQMRIAELEKEQKELAAASEALEGELYLMEQFDRTKVAMLEGRINGQFAMARFKMFNEQINGGLAPCCEVTYNGVPYSGGLNNAARINIGLDIINTLSAHYDKSMPIIIDNAESVCELAKTEAQVIRLVVSEKDAALRVELAGNQMEKAA